MGLMGFSVSRLNGRNRVSVLLQSGGHKDLFVTNCEMNQTPFELEQRLSGVTIFLVLFDGIFNELAGEGVFQLGGDNGNAVKKMPISRAFSFRVLYLSCRTMLNRFC